MVSGKFITLEGGEGAGKSTQLKLLKDYISQKGFACIETREPGGTELAKKLRALIVEPQSERKSDMSELLMIYAARADHLEKLIVPSLKNGTIVICDRFNDSTIAYQHYARGICLDTIKTIDKLVVSKHQPDLTIILDISPENGLARSLNRFENIDNCFETKINTTVKLNDRDEKNELAFEMEGKDFHYKVREGFLTIAQNNKSRYHIVDGNLPKKQVFDQIKIIVDSFFEKYK